MIPKSPRRSKEKKQHESDESIPEYLEFSSFFFSQYIHKPREQHFQLNVKELTQIFDTIPKESRFSNEYLSRHRKRLLDNDIDHVNPVDLKNRRKILLQQRIFEINMNNIRSIVNSHDKVRHISKLSLITHQSLEWKNIYEIYTGIQCRRDFQSISQFYRELYRECDHDIDSAESVDPSATGSTQVWNIFRSNDVHRVKTINSSDKEQYRKYQTKHVDSNSSSVTNTLSSSCDDQTESSITDSNPQSVASEEQHIDPNYHPNQSQSSGDSIENQCFDRISIDHESSQLAFDQADEEMHELYVSSTRTRLHEDLNLVRPPDRVLDDHSWDSQAESNNQGKDIDYHRDNEVAGGEDDSIDEMNGLEENNEALNISLPPLNSPMQQIEEDNRNDMAHDRTEKSVNEKDLKPEESSAVSIQSTPEDIAMINLRTNIPSTPSTWKQNISDQEFSNRSNTYAKQLVESMTSKSYLQQKYTKYLLTYCIHVNKLQSIYGEVMKYRRQKRIDEEEHVQRLKLIYRFQDIFRIFLRRWRQYLRIQKRLFVLKYRFIRRKNLRLYIQRKSLAMRERSADTLRDVFVTSKRWYPIKLIVHRIVKAVCRIQYLIRSFLICSKTRRAVMIDLFFKRSENKAFVDSSSSLYRRFFVSLIEPFIRQAMNELLRKLRQIYVKQCTDYRNYSLKKQYIFTSVNESMARDYLLQGMNQVVDKDDVHGTNKTSSSHRKHTKGYNHRRFNRIAANRVPSKASKETPSRGSSANLSRRTSKSDLPENTSIQTVVDALDDSLYSLQKNKLDARTAKNQTVDKDHQTRQLSKSNNSSDNIHFASKETTDNQSPKDHPSLDNIPQIVNTYARNQLRMMGLYTNPCLIAEFQHITKRLHTRIYEESESRRMKRAMNHSIESNDKIISSDGSNSQNNIKNSTLQTVKQFERKCREIQHDINKIKHQANPIPPLRESLATIQTYFRQSHHESIGRQARMNRLLRDDPISSNNINPSKNSSAPIHPAKPNGIKSSRTFSHKARSLK